MLLAFITTYDLEVEQMDVKKTFLHGELNENIFMEQLKGKQLVCK